MKKIETSKIFLFVISFITIFVVGFSAYMMVKFETYEPLSYLIPAIFTELGAATGCYYWKSKSENRTKITLGAVKEIATYENLTEEQIRIVEALVNTLG